MESKYNKIKYEMLLVEILFFGIILMGWLAVKTEPL